MRNKILALTFLVGSFAFIQQEGVAGSCWCGPIPDVGGNNVKETPQQLGCTPGGRYVQIESKGMTLRPNQCFYDCHCPSGKTCKGADLDPAKGNTLPGECN